MLNRKKKKKRPRIWGARAILVIIWLNCFLVTGIAGSLIYGYMMLDLPSVESLVNYEPPMVTEVYSSDGRLMAIWYKEKRWPVPVSEIPDTLKNAFLAAEDARFYQHKGIDFIGVIRAIIKNVEAGTIVQGASTITQQVTRSLLLTRERTWLRKVKEAILAWQIDAALTKDQILNLYLNQIYLGSGAYGVEAAARTYFAKHVQDLSLAESALLAGLPQAPSRYDPYKNMDLAKKRQAYVLKRMYYEGWISREEQKRALQEKIVLKSMKIVPPVGTGYFIQDVRKELERRYGRKRLLTEGFKIFTTLDSSLQKAAVDAVNNGIESLCKRHPKDKALRENVQGALLSMDAQTGAILAMVGGQDYSMSQFNLTNQGRMQPGSSFKPIVYSTAMKKGLIQPNTIIVDEPISFPGSSRQKSWNPENYDRSYLGPITIRTALTYSRNIVAIKVAKMVGIKAIQQQARAMGISVPLANDLSIALGSSALPVIQLVDAYSVFVNQGKGVRAQYIEQIVDRHGQILEMLEPDFFEALDPVTAFQMAYLLMGVVQDGTGRYAKRLGIPVGGKTGTTDNCRDAWFVGFSPEVVTGTWIGRKDKKSLGRRETGSKVACPIWTNYMKATLPYLTRTDYDIPDGIAFVPVDRNTGEIVTPDSRRPYVWEALRKDDLPPLQPAHGVIDSIPEWLRGIGDFFGVF